MKKSKRVLQEQAQKHGGTGLTPKQERAALLLASGKSIADVAAQIGVNRCTIYDWQGIVTFQCFFNQQRRDYKEHFRNALFGLTDEALAAVGDCLHSNNEVVKFRAAAWLLEKVAQQPIGKTDINDMQKEQTREGTAWGVDSLPPLGF